MCIYSKVNVTYISISSNGFSSISHDSKSLESKYTKFSCTNTWLKPHSHETIKTTKMRPHLRTLIKPVSRTWRSSQITQNSFKERILFKEYCIHCKKYISIQCYDALCQKPTCAKKPSSSEGTLLSTCTMKTTISATDYGKCKLIKSRDQPTPLSNSVRTM